MYSCTTSTSLSPLPESVITIDSDFGFRFATFIAMEKYENSFGATDISQSSDDVFIKFGAFASLSF